MVSSKNQPWQYESPQQVREILQSLAEPAYRDFAASLVPGEERLLGVRLPKLRQLAKQLARSGWQEWLAHEEDLFFEETMLRGMTLGYIKEGPQIVLPACRAFIPRIQNWSVCDSFCSSLKLLGQYPEEGWAFLLPYAHSVKEFEARVGAVLLLDYYLTPEWIDRALALLCEIRQEGYYAQMAVAWAFSMAWVKFPEKTGAYLQPGVLAQSTRKKALQKIRESRQVKPGRNPRDSIIKE